MEVWAMEPTPAEDTLSVDRKPGSVTQRLSGLKRGSAIATGELLGIYYKQLADYLERMYGPTPRTDDCAADIAKDAAVSAWCSFISYVKTNVGRITLEDRDDLWGLLATIALRKLWKYKRKQRLGTDLPQIVLATDLERPGGEDSYGPVLLAELAVSGEPGPEDRVLWDDALQYCLGLLKPKQRAVVEIWMQGLTPDEIAEKLKIGRATVYRRLEEACTRMRKACDEE
jgi:DNA-directed RNA polymerase specialized sigma24 family protein